ncbi:12300_t:CDS:2, partial [Entrophospora sp. SA101]
QQYCPHLDLKANPFFLYSKSSMLSEAIEVLSTSGIEEYIGLRDQCIRDADGFLLVYSLISRPTFERIERHKDHIMRIKDSGKNLIIKKTIMAEIKTAKGAGQKENIIDLEHLEVRVPLVLRIPDRLLMIRNRVMTMNQQYVELERQYVELEQQYVELGQDFIWLRCRDTINNTMDLNNQNM